MKLDALKKIYFIGIGGIGMSALARYFNQYGAHIAGYDKTETRLTKKLVSEGMEIHYVDEIERIPDEIDMVVYTPAIPKEHKELSYLRTTGIPVLKRSEVLGIISREKKCIAVAGTHGKTTTSSMVAHLLKFSGLDISCFLGGIANNFQSNYCYGESEWTVIEADEFDRSFHTLSPEIAVLISMDPDHLDIYGEKENMQASFETFLRKVNDGGRVVMHKDLVTEFSDDFLAELEGRKIKVETYGLQDADYALSKLAFRNGRQVFDMNEFKEVELSMPGEHNTQNMGAAMAVAQIVGRTRDEIIAGVKTFSGIKRRFEITEGGGITYVDDYAHHPSELKAAIGAAKKLWPKKKVTVVFQPHLFSRTNDFMDDFAKELSKADELILMEIYPAREEPMAGVRSWVLLEKIDIEKKALVGRKELMQILVEKEIEVLMTLGAGDIDVFAPQIREWINRND